MKECWQVLVSMFIFSDKHYLRIGLYFCYLSYFLLFLAFLFIELLDLQVKFIGLIMNTCSVCFDTLYFFFALFLTCLLFVSLIPPLFADPLSFMRVYSEYLYILSYWVTKSSIAIPLLTLFIFGFFVWLVSLLHIFLRKRLNNVIK
jgi:hypothetical protein